MRVIFVNRFYYPAETATAQLLTDLAEALVQRGWAVTVVTGHSQPNLSPRERHNGVEIVRLGRPMAATQNLRRRAVEFALFHLRAAPFLCRAARRNDIVVPLTDPPLIGVTAACATALRAARTVHWVQDIYPEVLAAVNHRGSAKLVAAFLRSPRNAAWRSASACVTLGDDMVAQIQRSGVDPTRIHCVPNWAPRGVEAPDAIEVQRLRRAWGVESKFVIGYSGNFGRVHDLRWVFEVAERLRSEPRFVFLFVGNGAAFTELEHGVALRKLGNVRILPARPRHELSTSLGVPDVHLVSVREGCESLVFPSKLYGIAAVGKPVLLLADPRSEIARAVCAHDFGVALRPTDIDGITRTLQTLASTPERLRTLAANASRFQAANGGSERAAAAWDAILRRVSGTASAARSVMPLRAPISTP